MGVAVGMAVAVGVSVGERVTVGLGMSVGLAVGEASEAAGLAQPARKTSIKSKYKVCRIASLLFLGGKCINTVGSIFIHYR